MVNYNAIAFTHATASVILLILTLSIQAGWNNLVQISNLLGIFPILASMIAFYVFLQLQSSNLTKPLSAIAKLLVLQVIVNFIGLFLPYLLAKLLLGAKLLILLPIPGYILVCFFLPQLMGTAKLRSLTSVLVGIAWICFCEYMFGVGITGYLQVALLNILGGLLLICYAFFILLMIALSSF